MNERSTYRVDVRWSALLKIIAAVVLVWLWLQLYQLVLLVIVALLMAVTINPAVRWLQHRGGPRWVASLALSFALLVATVGFVWMTWSSLSAQVTLLIANLGSTGRTLVDRVPPWLRDIAGTPDASSASSRVGACVFRLAQSSLSAVTITRG